MTINSKHPWIAQAKARGHGNMLSLALDALEPLGPLGAQVLWILQPTAGLFGGSGVRTAMAELAHALEERGGLEGLRAELARDEGHEAED